MEQLEDLLHTTDITYISDNTREDGDSPSEDNDTDLPAKYVPIIAAFKRSNNIICDTCGSEGHQASKYFKRGFNFLHRDVQHQITAYNAKYGSSPKTDSSTDPHKSYHALEPPDHSALLTSNKSHVSRSHGPAPRQVPTISSLDHVLPAKVMEEILDIELGTQPSPVIKMMEDSPNHSNISHL